MSDFFCIGFSNRFNECINGLIFHDADSTSTKSASCDTGTENTGDRPGKINKNIDLIAGNSIIIPQGNVGLVHQFTKFLDLSVLKCLYSGDRTLIFVNGMLCTFPLDLIRDKLFVGFKFFDREIT